MGNVLQAVPFFLVTDMDAALRFYVDGLGFVMKLKWTPEGKLRWCWLELGDAAVMLQESKTAGVSVCFICGDALALYHEAKARGLDPSRPFVGNGMWVTALTDPDGHRLEFESVTDVPEETEYTE